MRMFLTGLVAASIGLAAVSSVAQPTSPTGELAYCEQLFAIHERYLKRQGFYGEHNDPKADLGISLCRDRRLAEGIAILEGKLTRARFPLPARG